MNKLAFGFGLALLLGGCGEENEWTMELHERCRALGGNGVYVKSTKLFECFGQAKPFTFKFEINKEVDFKQPGRPKLFEERYVSK